VLLKVHNSVTSYTRLLREEPGTAGLLRNDKSSLESESSLFSSKYSAFSVSYEPHENNLHPQNLCPSKNVLLEKLNRSLDSKETPCILWKPNVRYRVHKKLPVVPILKPIHPAQSPNNLFIKDPFYITLSSTPRSSKSLSLSHKSPFLKNCFFKINLNFIFFFLSYTTSRLKV
jgi:hypothetical protein